MYKILSIGTSFNHGLGLHFYERYTQKLPLNYTLTPSERALNVYNAFHSILARKLNAQSEILNDIRFGLDTKFDDLIYGIKTTVEQEHEIPIKIVVIQLSTAEKDFFVYNDVIYRLDFNSAEELLISKDKLISTIPDNIKDDFREKLELDLNEYLSDTETWRKKHAIWFIDRLNELNKFLLDKGIILKVISYYSDFSPAWKSLDANIYSKIWSRGQDFSHIKAMCYTHKLRICDDINSNDEHPNFEAHQVVADSLYESIIKHPLYSTI